MMISLARKNIRNEKLKFAMSAIALGSTIMLVLILIALYRGWNTKLTAYISDISADIWVASEGSNDLFYSYSLFPDRIIDDLRNIKGVKRVELLAGKKTTIDINGEAAHLFVVGFDTTKGTGRPINVIKGSSLPGRHQIVIDEVFAKKYQLHIGDSIHILEREFTIVGIATGGNLVSFQLAYLSLEDARDIFNMKQVTNYALVTVDPDEQTGPILDQINGSISGITAVSTATFAANNKKQSTDIIVPIMVVIIVIGFSVGLILMSLTTYTSVVERINEFGIMKALGASHRHLYRIVIEYTLLVGVSGIAIGIGLTAGVARLTKTFEPSFATQILTKDIIAVVTVMMCLMMVAVIVPIRRIRRIDPVEVFKS
jgi:putative ABC transport system permease protein